MNISITNHNELIKKINEVLNDFRHFEQAFVNNNGDIKRNIDLLRSI